MHNFMNVVSRMLLPAFLAIWLCTVFRKCPWLVVLLDCGLQKHFGFSLRFRLI